MSAWYDIGLYNVFRTNIDLLNDTIKVMLVTTGYSFSPAHTKVSQVAVGELNTLGYIGGFGGRGRMPLIHKTITMGPPAAFNAAGLIWHNIARVENVVINAAVLIRELINDEESTPIAYITLSKIPTPTTDVILNWDGDILTLKG